VDGSVLLTSKTELSMPVCMAGLHGGKMLWQQQHPCRLLPSLRAPLPAWHVSLTSKPKRSLKPCFTLKKLLFFKETELPRAAVTLPSTDNKVHPAVVVGCSKHVFDVTSITHGLYTAGWLGGNANISNNKGSDDKDSATSLVYIILSHPVSCYGQQMLGLRQF